MELVTIIYLIEVVTNIKMWGLSDLIGIIFITHIPAAFVGFLVCGIIFDGNFSLFVKYKDMVLRKIVIIPLLVVFGFGSLFNALMPSKETAYVMLGAYGVQSVAETIGKNQEVQQIGKRTLSIVETALTKYEKELKAEEKELDNKK